MPHVYNTQHELAIAFLKGVTQGRASNMVIVNNILLGFKRRPLAARVVYEGQEQFVVAPPSTERYYRDQQRTVAWRLERSPQLPIDMEALQITHHLELSESPFWIFHLSQDHAHIVYRYAFALRTKNPSINFFEARAGQRPRRLTDFELTVLQAVNPLARVR